MPSVTNHHVADETERPTRVFERRIAEIDRGAAATAVASVASARALTLLTLAAAGETIVVVGTLAGRAHALLRDTLAQLGIRTLYVDRRDSQAIVAAIDHRTRAVYVIADPAIDASAIARLARLAHECNLPLVVDETEAMTPSQCLAHEADILIRPASRGVESVTPADGAVIVDRGGFAWHTTVRFARLVAQVEGPLAFTIHLRERLLPVLGTSLSPREAARCLRALDTVDRPAASPRQAVRSRVRRGAQGAAA